jgi:hypothetical protein
MIAHRYLEWCTGPRSKWASRRISPMLTS